MTVTGAIVVPDTKLIFIDVGSVPAFVRVNVTVAGNGPLAGTIVKFALTPGVVTEEINDVPLPIRLTLAD